MSHIIKLPPPKHTSVPSLESVFHSRTSLRAFAARALPLADLAQILWAGQGITSLDGRRTVPSAGGLHPLSLHVVTGSVQGAPAGVYRYRPNGHRLVQLATDDRHLALAEAAAGQEWMAAAAAVILIAADYARTMEKYGERGIRYVLVEAGAAAENISLEATALGLATVVVGAFDDGETSLHMALPPEEQPVALLPVGYPAEFTPLT